MSFNANYDKYVAILGEELIPAMGCTEPAAIAYAGAKAREILGCEPTSAKISVSGNIIKNVKSVVVPHTGGMRGIENALAAGVSVGDSSVGLQVLSGIKHEQIPQIAEFCKNCKIELEHRQTSCVFDIAVTLYCGEHSAYIRIKDKHTNIVELRRDGEILFKNEDNAKQTQTDRTCLSVEEIVEFADCVNVDDVRDILDRQISYNMAIAEEGIKNNWGANIGKVFLTSYPNDIKIKAKAYAAAGSDARMNGCELPVIINSGSGNQGMTTSIPVIVYARELGIDDDRLYRALCVANLVTIHLKSGIGTLSAYCGVVSAGAGAGCGIAYLLGGGYREIGHTLVNALAVDSGVICDGAKASCAAKIAIAVESGILGYEMYKQGNQFHGGDGIIKKGVENTISNVSRLARDGMKETDKEIINIMIEE
ncbi:MAG: serine dehydratase subunit alpha family protein [Ruminococcaceae bacterium]|nr:serine dehydratase subunit alpha family protein [Oscillospiraceae bacterium]